MGLKDLAKKSPVAETEAINVRDYLEQFKAIPLLDGQLVSGTVLAGEQRLVVRHSLKRAYVGGFVTSIDRFVAPHVFTPRVCAQFGFDPTQFVILFLDAPAANDSAINIWVF